MTGRRARRGALLFALGVIAAAVMAPAALAADGIYWTDPAAGKIRVGHLDGSGSPVTLFSAETTPNGVAIDRRGEDLLGGQQRRHDQGRQSRWEWVSGDPVLGSGLPDRSGSRPRGAEDLLGRQHQ